MEREYKKVKSIGVRLSPEEKDKVNYICAVKKMDISDAIRQLVHNEYTRLKETKEESF